MWRNGSFCHAALGRRAKKRSFKETCDELSAVGSTLQDSTLVKLALNFVSDEWQVFVQSILRRATLPNWYEMWATLKQGELRRDLVKCKPDESSNM